jgi:hypothetical protein
MTAPSSSKCPCKTNPNKAHLRCTNPHCGSKTGHKIADCIAYKGNKEGQYSNWWKGPWNIHLPESQHTKENNMPPKSHLAYARLSTLTVNQLTAANSSLERSTTSHIQSNNDPSQANSALTPDFYAWETQVCNSVAHTTLPILNPHLPHDNSCHYDFGANQHVFHNQSTFEQYESIQPVIVKGFGQSLSAVVIGKGNVCLEGDHNGQKCSILLTNVLHIPAAHTNLVSGLQLDKASIVSTLGHNTIFLSLNNKVIISGSVINDMYCLNLQIVPPISVILASRIKPASLALRIDPRNSQSDFYTASWGT